MTPRFLLFLPALLLLLPLGALAAERPSQYWGASLGDFEFETDNGSATNITNLGLKGGYRLSRFLALEIHGGVSTSGSSSEIIEEPDLVYGAGFVRLDLPYQRLNLYLLAGGSTLAYDVGDGSEEESDMAGGIGIELYGSERTALTLEYMNYNDGMYDGLSVGFVHHFDWPSFRH